MGFLVDGYNLQMCGAAPRWSLSCHIFLFSPSVRWRTAARVNVDVKGSGVLGSGVLVGSADDLGGNSIVGFLVDGYNLLCVLHPDGSCHIFLFSPSIRWRTAARVNVDVKEPYNFKA